LYDYLYDFYLFYIEESPYCFAEGVAQGIRGGIKDLGGKTISELHIGADEI
jgi:hypothetical protein